MSFLYFGIPVLPHFGRDFIGIGSDPQLFAWSLAWWPHAVLHGHNPFVSHVLWAPAGSESDLGDVGSRARAVPLAPVTLLAGPVAAYNVASILLPALAALDGVSALPAPDALVLAVARRAATSSASRATSSARSSRTCIATSVFLVPLAALFLLRFLEGELDGRGLAFRLGPLLALAVHLRNRGLLHARRSAWRAGLASRGAGRSGPAGRGSGSRSCRSAPRTASARVAVSPFIYYAVTGYNGVVTPTEHNPADVVTFAFPTALTAVGGRWAAHFNFHIPPISAEDGQYLGLPAIAIVVLFAVSRCAAAREPVPASSRSRSPCSRRSERTCGSAGTTSSRCRGRPCATHRSSTT